MEEIKKLPINTNIFKDKVFLLLLLNSGLVILAYGINTYTSMASQSIMLQIKSLFLVFSFLSILNRKKRTNKKIDKNIFIFFVVLFLGSFFSNDFLSSLERVIKFIFPFIYILFSVKTLLSNYHISILLKGFVLLLNITYIFPILIYFFLGAGFQEVNIYGFDENNSGSFVSNHYGWSSTIFLVSTLIILSEFKLNNLKKLFLIFMMVLSSYLVLISANRASWLVLILVMFFYIFKSTSLKTGYKGFIILVFTGFFLFLVKLDNSAINFVIEKNNTQQTEGEPRIIAFKYMVDAFNDNVFYWLHGVGFSDYKLLKEAQVGIGDYHNTYLEILFGCGIFVFFLFIYIVFYRPVLFFLNKYPSYFPVLIPILIIPYFENNLTAGQFLFFPLFLFTSITLIKNN